MEKPGKIKRFINEKKLNKKLRLEILNQIHLPV